MTAAPAHRGRRTAIVAVGAAGLAAGAGAAWWLRKGQGAPSAETQPFWALQSEQPDGSALSMASFRGRPVLVNFWATWCPPCVEELPMIDGFFRQHAPNGWQVVGLAVDKPAAVQTFLAKTAVSFPVGIVGLQGLTLVKALGNAQGGLPFTLVLNSDGNVHERKMGQITPEDLQRWATQISVS